MGARFSKARRGVEAASAFAEIASTKAEAENGENVEAVAATDIDDKTTPPDDTKESAIDITSVTSEENKTDQTPGTDVEAAPADLEATKLVPEQEIVSTKAEAKNGENAEIVAPTATDMDDKTTSPDTKESAIMDTIVTSAENTTDQTPGTAVEAATADMEVTKIVPEQSPTTVVLAAEETPEAGNIKEQTLVPEAVTIDSIKSDDGIPAEDTKSEVTAVEEVVPSTAEMTESVSKDTTIEVTVLNTSEDTLVATNQSSIEEATANSNTYGGDLTEVSDKTVAAPVEAELKETKADESESTNAISREGETDLLNMESNIAEVSDNTVAAPVEAELKETKADPISTEADKDLLNKESNKNEQFDVSDSTPEMNKIEDDILEEGYKEVKAEQVTDIPIASDDSRKEEDVKIEEINAGHPVREDEEVLALIPSVNEQPEKPQEIVLPNSLSNTESEEKTVNGELDDKLLVGSDDFDMNTDLANEQTKETKTDDLLSLVNVEQELKAEPAQEKTLENSENITDLTNLEVLDEKVSDPIASLVDFTNVDMENVNSNKDILDKTDAVDFGTLEFEPTGIETIGEKDLAFLENCQNGSKNEQEDASVGNLLDF
eukprot:GFUD01018519.1.p1 GENE.GFUD01018519.1~~GFUD01018519.1.p1  ORF type:complete len:606 (+),score=237.20 GFUD01018519.1:62-1879(+)